MLRTRLLSCGLALMAWGCDTQAGTNYQGESLLTLLGAVEIPEPRAAGPFVPALMFPDGASDYRLVDVTVKGEFPSDFRIDVYERPPSQVLQPVPFLKEPALAVGHITAVPQDHPETIRFASVISSSGSAACATPDCSSSCADTASCMSEALWCTDDGECYRETRICPRHDSPDGDCTVLESEGDPRLKLQPSQVFAGFSQNFLVAYLSEAVGTDSYTAFALGAHEPLSAGYHLLAVRAPSDDESTEIQTCHQHAEEIAVARINERRGTDYRAEELTSYVCFAAGDCAEGFDCAPPEDFAPQSRLCELSAQERAEIEALFETASQQAAFDFRCPGRWVMTHVPEPERERISVRLDPDANPWQRPEAS